jgi:uncharacterized repeat protein (TIGR03803 family)
VVFELLPQQGGGYAETVLHVFGHGKDGRMPTGRLVMDSAGNLYGTTTEGGDDVLRGTVFKLSPKQGGGYTETVLHSFGGQGIDPLAGVILDGAGNIYGTTYLGGLFHECNYPLGCGTVFKLSPDGKDGWTETSLHQFRGGSDGAFPVGGLVMDSAGILYGTTSQGGNNNSCVGCGTVFRLIPTGGGNYRENVIHSFHRGFDGAEPHAGLIIDSTGTLYGTTSRGGIYDNCFPGGGCGTVFRIRPNHSGWSVKVLHAFGDFDKRDGSVPYGELITDSAGNLYGTTSFGGNEEAEGGIVFKLSPNQGDGYTETVLHNFGNEGDGKAPHAGLVMDSAGNLYGTTYWGGKNRWGTAFKIVRNPPFDLDSR